MTSNRPSDGLTIFLKGKSDCSLYLPDGDIVLRRYVVSAAELAGEIGVCGVC